MKRLATPTFQAVVGKVELGGALEPDAPPLRTDGRLEAGKKLFGIYILKRGHRQYPETSAASMQARRQAAAAGPGPTPGPASCTRPLRARMLRQSARARTTVKSC